MMYRKKKKDVMKASQIGPHGRLKLGFKGLLGTSCTAGVASEDQNKRLPGTEEPTQCHLCPTVIFLRSTFDSHANPLIGV